MFFAIFALVVVVAGAVVFCAIMDALRSISAVLAKPSKGEVRRIEQLTRREQAARDEAARKYLNRQDGFALAVTLLVLFCITAGTLAVTQLAVSAAHRGRTAELQQRADAAAEGAAEVMASIVAQAPVTATSQPSLTFAIGGMAAAVSADYDIGSGVWTLRATSGGRVVTERWSRIDGRLTRLGWSTGV